MSMQHLALARRERIERGSGCGRGALAANSLMSRRVTSGEMRPWPRATVRTASTSASGSADFRRKPAAPARSASKTTSSRSNVVTTSTSIGAPVAGWASSRVAARPSMRGMRTSISDEVGVTAVRERDGLDAVGGLPDDLDVGLGLEDRPQPAADDRLIVREQHADDVIAWRAGRAGRRGQHGVDAPAEAVGARARLEPAADERRALAHPGDAAAVADGPVAPRAVVADVDERLAVREVDRHGGRGGRA